ncbi:ribose-phosphate pyrophosphokinase [Dongia sp.]|uniref:ribose-phosphate pyrophosphokinase n=1 Tax=Dongia sp. TaxID=1977262 RepID=UPI0037530E52
MSNLLLMPMPGNEEMTSRLGAVLGADVGILETRRFPDGEAYLRLRTDVSGRSLAIVCTLDRPDEKFLPLSFAASTARDLGAARIGLIAPYLAYMRQDKRFNEGEAITSKYFAALVSPEFDWLVTVDPHLHRYSSLGEIYAIPSRTVHAGPALSDWIQRNVTRPLVIGPDIESEQWVQAVARAVGCPYAVLRKERLGDRDVVISLPDLSAWKTRMPVLVDDIASSARTMIEACRKLVSAGLPAPICIAIHALLADDAYKELGDVAARVVTTNTVVHESNDIDLCGLIAPEARTLSGL